MTRSSSASCLQRGNLCIIFCLVWTFYVLYSSSPFLTNTSYLNSDSKGEEFEVRKTSSGNIMEPANENRDRTGDIGPSSQIIIGSHHYGYNSHEDDSSNSNYTSAEYMKHRMEKFNSWFQGNETKILLPDADENGTILDFAIVGFPKCGTTTVEANLGYLAPMPIKDICTPVHQTVWYAYKNWPKDYQKQGEEEKLWRGTKCPAFIQGKWLLPWSQHLPRTKLIVGIRHPVLWFQSFWNMLVANHLTTFAGDDPYKIMEPCPYADGRGCRNGCPHRQLLCMHRGRFHVALASLGKTELSAEERKILAAGDPDGGTNVPNHRIRNSIFIYEQRMLGEEYLWEEMASYLGTNHLRHDKRVNSHGKNRSLEIDFCHDNYDAFRAKMMPISYEVAMWLQLYLLPVARNKSRVDVVVAKPDAFYELVEKYKSDPCGKLQRIDDGTFVKA